ncbi:helix-turn-helix domain-containing protein [Streptomyces globisporus]|nr:helix-turn-helix domain-containing protein [Streptomyces globisporus]
MLRTSEPDRQLAATGRTRRDVRMDTAPGAVAEQGEELAGTTVSRRFGEAWVCVVEAGPGEVSRPGRAGPAAETYLRVLRPLVGEVHVEQDGRRAVACSSQLVCYDSSRPHRISVPEDLRMVTLALPHRSIGLTPKESDLLTARVWHGSQGLGALMSELLAGLERYGEEVDTAIDLLGGSVAGLAGALFAERIRSAAAASGVGRQTLMVHVQAFIRDNIAVPELSPVTVAQQHNVSLRYLQKIFNEHNTSPARWIRDERLARCRCELADPGLAHLSIAAIGERSGFYGASHFSRLFRDRYGVTPREYRKTMRPSALTA